MAEASFLIKPADLVSSLFQKRVCPNVKGGRAIHYMPISDFHMHTYVHMSYTWACFSSDLYMNMPYTYTYTHTHTHTYAWLPYTYTNTS